MVYQNDKEYVVFNIDDANGLVAKLHDIASAEMQSQATAGCTEVKQ